MESVPLAISLVERGLKGRPETIDTFCRAVGIHRATWQRWKANKTSPTAREIRKMIEVAARLGIELRAEQFIEAA